MKIWKYTVLDSLLFAFSIFQFVFMIGFAYCWGDLGNWTKFALFSVLCFLTTYNIIVVSHLFTHTPWFNSKFLNSCVSVLNTINIGQSVQEYQLFHVRNHHKYNNDQKGVDGKTKDLSSTYQKSKDNEHSSLFRYAVLGGLKSFAKILISFPINAARLWKVGKNESAIFDLLTPLKERQKQELQQLRADRLVHGLSLVLFLLISWQWTLICYLPACLIAFCMVNIQNYYEHYGANPATKFTNSVSYYGRLYNILSFNDGYHQEHHLYCGAHWTTMPKIYNDFFSEKSAQHTRNRIISPFPAILGFLDFKRPLLHQNGTVENLDLMHSEEGIISD